MYVLGIETSCDETAVAILDYTLVQHGLYSNHNLPQKTTEREKNQTKILSNIVYSQIKDHSPFGGVVPEIAARKHVVLLDGLIKEALFQADLSMKALDLIAVTRGPGLVGGLMVGLMSAKALSIGLNIPFIGVNHLEGHALTARLSDSVSYPYLLLLVSGGHSQIIFVEGLGRYQRIGSTIDDALGEAFDKTAKLMGLPYPGGPYVEQYAKNGDAKRFAFPRPLAKDPRIAFSFSGLKTAVRQTILKLQDENKKQNKGGEYFLTEQDICDLCASFQAAILDVLEIKLEKSFCLFKEKYPDTCT